jgi:hypothetical protein
LDATRVRIGIVTGTDGNLDAPYERPAGFPDRPSPGVPLGILYRALLWGRRRRRGDTALRMTAIRVYEFLRD